ncbi:DUF1801 domain-containing protein [Flavobacterium sp. UMI-01]|uniref:DUF1801 domain-containing protein n=1 Tax=Flavobacterium sp. UMI-01 TaxID=1441053 RepID=UPI001C7CBC54|nr:DUF1801 domain-containing protein [Flavobacterium sp. UMI-01]GIZ09809.1 hypothetical protein FUMI01_25360 [Flavobacterium sp. UMI-01]
MTPLDEFYQRQQEPLKGVYLALRDIILKQDENITHSLKYGCPFFSYKGKMFCYLWFHKKFKQPYISLVEGMLFDEPFLLQEKRARMKIMLLDMDEDLPIEQIEAVIQKAISFYKTGLIKVKK